MHLDDAAIQSLLIGESAPESEAQARAHLASCAECGARWAAAERETEDVARLLQRLDQPASVRSLPDLVARAQRLEDAPPPVRSQVLAPPARTPYRWLRRAAAIVVALGLLRGAYAMPGSPLPKWVAAVVERVTNPAGPASIPDPAPRAEAPPPTPVPEPETGMSGIAVTPGASLLILFRQPAGEGEIQVALVDDREVQVRAPIGAATFTSGANRILIDHPTSAAVFEVAIPRSAPRVEIQVDGRRVFLKQGTQVTTATPAGPGATYVLPLVSAP